MNFQKIQEIDAATAPSGCLTCGQQQAVTAFPGQIVAAPAAGQTDLAASPAGQISGRSQTAPITATTQPAPLTLESTEYLNGFLRTQIGQRVRVSFLIGTNSFLDKAGKLLDVGANYIILQEAMTDDLLVCDFYTIKFVTIFR